MTAPASPAQTLEPTMNFRWLRKAHPADHNWTTDTLQQAFVVRETGHIEWSDVPVVQETL